VGIAVTGQREPTECTAAGSHIHGSACYPPAGRAVSETYRYAGVTRDGTARTGKMTYQRTSGLGVFTASAWRSGWQSLTVAAGDGPVPPAPDEQKVAWIDRSATEGARVWWAES